MSGSWTCHSQTDVLYARRGLCLRLLRCACYGLPGGNARGCWWRRQPCFQQLARQRNAQRVPAAFVMRGGVSGGRAYGDWQTERSAIAWLLLARRAYRPVAGVRLRRGRGGIARRERREPEWATWRLIYSRGGLFMLPYALGVAAVRFCVFALYDLCVALETFWATCRLRSLLW